MEVHERKEEDDMIVSMNPIFIHPYMLNYIVKLISLKKSIVVPLISQLWLINGIISIQVKHCTSHTLHPILLETPQRIFISERISQ
jgi:hypothetical protein